MTAIGIAVDGMNVYGPDKAQRIEVVFPAKLFELGHDFVQHRCTRCQTPLRQTSHGQWVDTLDGGLCAASVPIEHDPERVPPANIRKIVIEIGDLLGIAVHVAGWRHPVRWHVNEDGYVEVEPDSLGEFRIIRTGGHR